MNIGLVSSRYAKALLSYAIEKDVAKRVYSEVKSLYKNISDNPDLIKALSNPFLADKQKRDLMITASGGDICEVFERFIDLLIKNDRMEELSFICLKYLEAYRKYFNIYQGKLITVVKWSDAEIEKLKKIILKGHKGEFEFEYVVDESIIGGFIFEIDNVRLDASIANQIRHIRNELLDRNKRIV